MPYTFFWAIADAAHGTMNTPRTAGSLKIKLAGTNITGIQTPSALTASSDSGVQRTCFKKNNLRRRVPKALPTASVLNRMGDEFKGRDCCRGSKEWGDGKGSEVFGDGLTFYCHACLVELAKPAWMVLGFANQAECDSFGELNFD